MEVLIEFELLILWSIVGLIYSFWIVLGVAAVLRDD